MIRLGRVAMLAALGGLAWTGLACTGTAAADTYRLMTGPQGGVWVPLGGALKNLWEKAIPGLTVQTLPGAGIANVRGIEEGKTDIGFGNSISTVDGIAGREPFPAATKNVCQRDLPTYRLTASRLWENAVATAAAAELLAERPAPLGDGAQLAVELTDLLFDALELGGHQRRKAAHAAEHDDASLRFL